MSTTINLSQFDLSWFSQHTLKHRYLDEWSRPGLTNFLGSLQADADPTAIKHPMIPPVSSAEETTCFLTVNGEFLPASGQETEISWCPWAIKRKCLINDWKIESTLTMPPEHHGALQKITLTNTSPEPQQLDLEVRLSGRCVNEGLDGWFWRVPAIAVTVDELEGHAGLDPIIETHTDGCLFKNRDGQKAVNAQYLSPQPDRWRDHRNAVYQRHIAAGESFELWFSLALGEDESTATKAKEVLKNPESQLAAPESMWRDLWNSIFTGRGDYVSGQLPDLELPKKVAPLAAATICTALQLRRTHLPNRGKTRYSTSTPRRVEAGFYIWDWSMASRLLSTLDPKTAFEQLEMALAIDHDKHQQINALTGAGDGWPYAYDTYNLFRAIWNQWIQNGRSDEFLQRKVVFDNDEHSILKVLEALAKRYEKIIVPEIGLADYGGKEGLLECVSTYQHCVAGLNGAAVWMLERLAELEPAMADQALAKADALFDTIMEKLYIEDEGCFYCIYPDGRKFLVRHALDIQTFLCCVGHRLSTEIRAKIQAFAQTELMTPNWLRALSPRDSDAAVSGIRADHQFCGAYGAWPAQMGLGLLAIDAREVAEQWTRNMAIVSRQGPIGQAYFDEITEPTPEGMPLKVTDEMPHACHWAIIGGGEFWELIEKLYS